LEAVGSKAVIVQPEKNISKKKQKDGQPSAEIFVAGKRKA
jgi:hypothetical protein